VSRHALTRLLLRQGGAPVRECPGGTYEAGGAASPGVTARRRGEGSPRALVMPPASRGQGWASRRTPVPRRLSLSKLPPAKEGDFRAGKGIGFMFIPFFNLYWLFRFVLSLTDRLNFQFRLRGQKPPISRGLALASCIVYVIPYVDAISWLLLMPIVAGQMQAATNRLVDEQSGLVPFPGSDARRPPVLAAPENRLPFPSREDTTD